MSESRKKRRTMTDLEKAYDWQDRLSPRWWRVVFVLSGVSIALVIVAAVMRAVA